jgi:hypothetical protein
MAMLHWQDFRSGRSLDKSDAFATLRLISRAGYGSYTVQQTLTRNRDNLATART